MIDPHDLSTYTLLGKYVHQVCHNLRNPLSHIVTASALGSEQALAPEEARQLFSVIRGAALRLTEIIRSAEHRAVHEMQHEMQRTDIGALIDEQIAFFEFDPRLRYRVSFRRRGDTDPTMARVVPAELVLIISSMMLAFLDASEPTMKYEITVTTSQDDVGTEVQFRADGSQSYARALSTRSETLREEIQELLDVNRYHFDCAHSGESFVLKLAIPRPE